jgi:hypothetical protein
MLVVKFVRLVQGSKSEVPHEEAAETVSLMEKVCVALASLR